MIIVNDIMNKGERWILWKPQAIFVCSHTNEVGWGFRGGMILILFRFVDVLHRIYSNSALWNGIVKYQICMSEYRRGVNSFAFRQVSRNSFVQYDKQRCKKIAVGIAEIVY